MQTETDELLNLLKYTEPLFLRSTPLGSYVYKNKLCYKHATPKGSNNRLKTVYSLKRRLIKRLYPNLQKPLKLKITN